MPQNFKEPLNFYISSSKVFTLENNPVTNFSDERNYICYITAGHCIIEMLGKTYPLPKRTLIYIARKTHYKIYSPGNVHCSLQVLELTKTEKMDCFNLKALCAQTPLIDNFMTMKRKDCFLIDCENIYLTINELINEYNSNHAEKNLVITSLLSVIYIKMARSFQLHGKPSGVQYITQAKGYIASHFSEDINVQMIADNIGISRSYLQILFKKYAKRSIIEQINGVRIHMAAYLLTTTDNSILDIAIETGYNNRQHFTRTFRSYMGIPPIEYRKKNTPSHKPKFEGVS